jgi:hypothetical protein
VRACFHDARSTCQEQFWPHTMNLMFKMFQNLEIKLLVDSLTRWNKLLVYYLFAVKETNQHYPGFLHLHFLGAGWSWRHPLHALLLCPRVILKNLTFILIIDSDQPVIIPLICCRRSAYASLLHCSRLSVTLFGTILSQTFFIPKFSIKTNCSLSVDIRFLCNHYDSKISTIPHHSSHCSTFSYSPDVVGLPGQLSNSTLSSPFQHFHLILMLLLDIQICCQTSLHLFLQKIIYSIQKHVVLT